MMLLDYFGVFSWIYGKMDEINKIWVISRVLRRGIGIPRNCVGPCQDVACPCQGMAERGLGQASGTPQHNSATLLRRSTPRRSYCSQHVDFCVFFLFCYSIIPSTFLLD